MENVEKLILEDGKVIDVYFNQQCIIIEKTVLKFDEFKKINNMIRKHVGNIAGRKQRRMPKGFPTLLEKGLSYNELAKVYNCSKTTISRWKREIKSSEV